MSDVIIINRTKVFTVKKIEQLCFNHVFIISYENNYNKYWKLIENDLKIFRFYELIKLQINRLS